MPVVLTVGDDVATIDLEEGGRLAQLTLGGRELLRGRQSGEHAWGMWGSYPLIPWSNRVAGGRFTFAGHEWELPDRWLDGTALHGLVCRRPWRLEGATPTTAELALDVTTPPWTLACAQTFELAAGGLMQRISVRNEGAGPVPVGLGIHPWFPLAPVQVPADLIWPAEGCIPTGRPRPVAGEEDLRRPVLPPLLDDCYTGLTATSARIGDIELSWNGPVRHVVVYTGEPGWVCVEPVTNANDGFNLLARGEPGSGVLVLAPGERVAVTYRFRIVGVEVVEVVGV
jgi:aldose 1-epimerase